MHRKVDAGRLEREGDALKGRETAADSERERVEESERVFVWRCLRWCHIVCHNKLCDLKKSSYPHVHRSHAADCDADCGD